jgi:outer membrane lipoprotein SlyB
MTHAKTGLLALTVFLLVAAGCASSMSGNAYSRDQARKAQSVDNGTVIYVRQVQIEGTKSGLGTIAGGILGAALGSTIGDGSGRIVATAAGGVAGGVAGSAAEEGITRQDGLEITVELDTGEVVAVAQAADVPFDVGDRVRVLRRPDGSARVTQ